MHTGSRGRSTSLLPQRRAQVRRQAMVYAGFMHTSCPYHPPPRSLPYDAAGEDIVHVATIGDTVTLHYTIRDEDGEVGGLGGGPWLMLNDACSAHKVALASRHRPVHSCLRALLPPASTTHSPLIECPPFRPPVSPASVFKRVGFLRTAIVFAHPSHTDLGPSSSPTLRCSSTLKRSYPQPSLCPPFQSSIPPAQVFKRVGPAAIRLLLIPGLTEAAVDGALSMPLLGLPVFYGFTLGFILKAVG